MVLTLQIAAGIVLAAIVLKYPREIVRWVVWLLLVLLVVGTVVAVYRAGGVRWSVIGGLWVVWVFAALRQRRGLTIPKDHRP